MIRENCNIFFVGVIIVTLVLLPLVILNVVHPCMPLCDMGKRKMIVETMTPDSESLSTKGRGATMNHATKWKKKGV